MFASTLAVLVGCLRQGPALSGDAASDAQPQAVAMPTSTPAPLAGANLGLADPQVGWSRVGGQAITVSTSSIQVLPNGNVPAGPSSIPVKLANDQSSTPTRWVKNAAPTTLWSGPDGSATAFTDVPAGSFFRATGPANGQRLPVFYVGDGLLRKAGDGWVDTAAIATVDAPAPGDVPAVDADASQPLPVWVQAHKASALWSGPDNNAVKLTDLPQWTFLKVAGIEQGGRLLVNYAGDYANRQPGIGWVDQSDVGPSGDPGVWVTNHRATPLWSGIDGQAVKFTDLPQWSKLRIVPDAQADNARMEVEFFGDGFTRQPGMAWVARADIGPITPPVPLPSTPPAASATSDLNAQHATFSSSSDFIAAVGAAAQSSRKTTGVPASVTVAQAILESDWGRSALTRQGNNLFGIKALGGATGTAGIITLATWEHTSDGGDVLVNAPFKAYNTLEQSIDDHGKFFTSNKRYAGALAVANDPKAFAEAIQNAGYATDPSYASKLISLMDRSNLYRFD